MALAIAAVLATSVTAVAVVLRGVDLLSGSSGADRSSSDLVPLLFAIAALCSAGLLRVRSRTWAWVALVVAAGLAALEVVGVVRGWQALASPGAWPWLVVVAEAALLAASSVAAIYVTDPRPGQAAAWRLVRRIVVVPAFAALVVVAGWAVVGSFSAAAPPTAGIDPLRLSGRLCAAFVAVSALAGCLRDLLGPVRRARRRATTLRELPRALGDELLPNAAAMRRRGREAEQARLAADLHALVLPDLRRAAAAAEASGSGGATVAAGLRDVVDDVERLIHVRQSIVLEEYGLVAALEWLAERTQQRDSIQVDIDLDGARVDEPNGIPSPVARAAFRIALLALDNVVRHAAASHVSLDLTVADGMLRLAIEDDGRGVDARGDRAGPAEARGIRDMELEASDVGGVLRVQRLERGTGVELTWSDHGHALKGSRSVAPTGTLGLHRQGGPTTLPPGSRSD